MSTISGKVWKFGDAIDTDVIIPARYLILPLDEMKQYAMEPIRSEFAGQVGKGDVIVGGRNFGCGSSREQAPAVLKELGITAIVAVSFARIFFRNAINLGIPLVECEEIYSQVEEGDNLQIDFSTGKLRIPDRNLSFSGSKLPDFLLEIIEDGGLIPHLVSKK